MVLFRKNLLNFNKILKRSLYSFWSKRAKKSDHGQFNIVKEIGTVSPERPVPYYIPKPLYFYQISPTGSTSGDPEIKNEVQIARMRQSCKLAANILNSCTEMVQEGITTDEIDGYVHDQIIGSNAYPSTLRYGGFPKSICTSVNNVTCHGIPDDRKLMDGDIINIDITVFLNGYHGDCSRTFLVGNVDRRGKHLVKSTEECLYNAINLCGPGISFNKIGCFIESFAKKKRLTPVPYFIGHGIGCYFHGPPEILHFKNNVPGEMKPGMTFTIEPILSLGGGEIKIKNDNWTAISTDNSRSAQFEHTVLITENGFEILTTPD